MGPTTPATRHAAKALAASGHWDAIPLQTLERALDAAAIITLRPGQKVFHQGDEAEGAYVVISGRLRLEQASASGENTVLRYVGAGEIAAILAALQAIPLPATATVANDAVLAYWPLPVFQGLMQKEPLLSMQVARLAGRRIVQLQMLLRQRTEGTVESRIAVALLHAAGQEDDDAHAATVAISRRELADVAGVSIYTISRTLTQWQRAGIVDAPRRRAVAILKPDRLARFARS
ncbi:MAG: Crp/Fnr family transcriptional regulator [Pseudomonadota bacterium]